MIGVEIWSDFVCPFCYIGKANFEMALASFEGKDQVQVVYKSFELDPEAQKNQNVNIYEMLAKKFGKSVDWAKQMNDRVVQTALESGLTFNMDKVVPTNSFDGHRLSQLAHSQGIQGKTMDALFAAYFTHGKNLSDSKTLVQISEDVGFKTEDVEAMLSSNKFSSEVRADEMLAKQIGIQGVPLFVFNQKFAVSGAQPVEVFQKAFTKASAEV